MQAVLCKLCIHRVMTRQVAAWLKSDILDEGKYIFSEKGTPQGGVMSPFLPNMALHGLQTHLSAWIRKYSQRDSKEKTISPTNRDKTLKVTRHADDFVLLHVYLKVIEQGRRVVKEWLDGIGVKIFQKPDNSHSSLTPRRKACIRFLRIFYTPI